MISGIEPGTTDYTGKSWMKFHFLAVRCLFFLHMINIYELVARLALR
jgi:hypothetical protein